MSDLGKIDRELFDTVIYPELGADREDVTLGPTHGIDFGVIDVGGDALVTATDPLSVLPDLGFERAGRFALDVVLADVAVSGIAPSHLSVTFTLPPAMSDDELAAMWHGFAGRAEEVGVSVVTGHTARYAGVDYSWVGGATVLGVGSHDDIVRPDGARAGDKLVVGTGPGPKSLACSPISFRNRSDCRPTEPPSHRSDWPTPRSSRTRWPRQTPAT